jgi:hypothetical protein
MNDDHSEIEESEQIEFYQGQKGGTFDYFGKGH